MPAVGLLGRSRDSMNLISQLALLLRRMPWLMGRVSLTRSAAMLINQTKIEFPMGAWRLRFDLRDPYQAAMALDCYEADVSHLLARILRIGDTYVDVGAQLGYTAAHASIRIGPTGRMVLYEPDPEARRRLMEAIPPKDQSNTPSIRLFKEACSDSEGELRLLLAPILGQSTSMDIRLKGKDRGRIAVPTVRLDASLESEGIKRIRLLKMDIEGHELFALRGLVKYLEARDVEFFIIEKNVFPLEFHGFSADHLHASLAYYGYTGAHTDGRRITAQSLGGERIENLIYARDDAMLAEIFPKLDPATESDFPRETIKELHGEVFDDPKFESRRLIGLMKQGQYEEALRQGDLLLKTFPDAVWFRGHYAHWLRTLGREADAVAQYQRILSDDPGNIHARRALGQQV
ncbi:FkbM family methyltransferase [Candidatus Sumerlaeota bacterium]|nr:FkbM family methyltransferase [Candidatus Sumerlaeota bacterium]